jgi:hypothetical protein
VWRTRPRLDPAWTLVSTLVFHVLSCASAVASAFEPDQNMLLRTDFKVVI